MTHLATRTVSFLGTLGLLFLPAAAFGPSAKSQPSEAPTSASLLSPGSLEQIAQGSVAIEHNWLPPDLVASLRSDARELFARGNFQPDGRVDFINSTMNILLGLLGAAGAFLSF